MTKRIHYVVYNVPSFEVNGSFWRIIILWLLFLNEMRFLNVDYAHMLDLLINIMQFTEICQLYILLLTLYRVIDFEIKHTL